MDANLQAFHPSAGDPFLRDDLRALVLADAIGAIHPAFA